MPKRTKSTPPVLRPRLTEWQLSPRTQVRPDDLVRISGTRGEFIVKWIDEDGTLAVWGGTGGKKKMRAFRPDRVTSVKHPKDGRT